MPYFPPIQQDQYPATDETQCIEIIIPAGDEFKALLAGLMVAAADVNSYADPESAAAEGQAAIWDEAYSQIDWNGCPVEGIQTSITLLHSFAEVVSGNALQLVLDAAQAYSTYNRQNTAANADRTRYWMKLAPGDYTFKMLHLKGATNGIVHIVLFSFPGDDDVAIATSLDLYNASTLRNQLYEVGFTVNVDALYHLDIFVDGKNASSSSFHVPITAIYIEPDN